MLSKSEEEIRKIDARKSMQKYTVKNALQTNTSIIFDSALFYWYRGVQKFHADFLPLDSIHIGEDRLGDLSITEY
jgi:hypothetical protein